MIITILVNLISNYRYLMEPLGEKSIEHLFREANGCRDHLANLAGDKEEGLFCFSIRPFSLLNQLYTPEACTVNLFILISASLLQKCF